MLNNPEWIMSTVASKEVPEVLVNRYITIGDGWERELKCKLFRYTHCTNVDPQDSLC